MIGKISDSEKSVAVNTDSEIIIYLPTLTQIEDITIVNRIYLSQERINGISDFTVNASFTITIQLFYIYT